jgi:phosphopantetheinyl transferase
MKPFYIGLSLVSNPKSPGALHTSGRRTLALLNGGAEEIGTEKGGRPFFTGAHADFSISHSRNMAAVAYWSEKKQETGLPLRTGCDIQYVKPLKNLGEIARRQYSPEEQGYIAAASDEAVRIATFYRIWVLKECYLKARGLSVFDMPSAPSFADANGLFTGTKEPLHFYLYELGEKYVLAAARESVGPYDPFPLPEFRWFSNGLPSAPLPLRSIAAIKAVVNPVNTVSPNI